MIFNAGGMLVVALGAAFIFLISIIIASILMKSNVTPKKRRCKSFAHRLPHDAMRFVFLMLMFTAILDLKDAA